MSSLPDNVRSFLDKAASAYGKSKEEDFHQFMWSTCCEIASPIEQMFLIGLNLVAEINIVNIGIAKGFVDDNDHLLVIPQWNVGKYKVDFAIRRHPVDIIVCVELDGHDFHDRNESQRRYEKRRDRLLTSKGYKVLHFTGSEVVQDPCAVALEAFNLACDSSEFTIHPFEGP